MKQEINNQTKKVGRPKDSGCGKSASLTKEDIELVIKSLAKTTHEIRNKTIIYLGLGSAMRVSEICNLSISSILDEKGKIKDEIILSKHTTKNGKSRNVFLSNQSKRQLCEYIKFLKDERKALNPTDPLFPSQKGGFFNTNAFTQLVNRIFKSANINNAKSHSLRVSCINRLRENCVDLYTIMQQTGHAHLSTLQIYFRENPANQKKAMENLKF